MKASLSSRLLHVTDRLSAAAGLPSAPLSKGCKSLGRLSAMPATELPALVGTPAETSLVPGVSNASLSSCTATESDDEPANAVRWTSVLHPDDRIPGTWLVNQYLILQFLGKGVSGRVFLVMDVQTHRLYALKSMKRKEASMRRRPLGGKAGGKVEEDALAPSGTSLAGAGVVLRQEVREIRIMARLRHPNLPRLHEVIDDPGHPRILLIMTLAEGGCVMSRADLEAERGMGEARARHIFRGAARGLHELHRAGIVHGDIKPENVLQGSSVWLSDFGCSYFAQEGLPARRSRGTPAFLAPELVSAPGQPGSTKASDVYALGASLFTLVFGRIPYRVASLADLFQALATRPLRQLLFGCLQKDPARRLTLRQVLAHRWTRQRDSQESVHGMERLLRAAGSVTVQQMAGARPRRCRASTARRRSPAGDSPVSLADSPALGEGAAEGTLRAPPDAPCLAASRLGSEPDAPSPEPASAFGGSSLAWPPEERKAERIAADKLPRAGSVPEALQPAVPCLEEITKDPGSPDYMFEGIRRAKEQLRGVARTDGGWAVARHGEGELLGTSKLLSTVERSFLGVTKRILDGLYVSAGEQEAVIAILPGSKIRAAWEDDDMLRWMLQRLAWREETELVALQGLLVMANPRVAVDSKSFPAAKEF
ncbi:hypothetical protein QBZ16_001201 [Prototheca wickerhamii]|uniref:Protein kinase domain-containing protein n=1 Tax=Prototheca wickerhamii TaxID=3111 RepID=A0AAD9IFP5_PROWI|nr:hypothetical protein QBZ16_001201 [Prototheca wickerhamii]